LIEFDFFVVALFMCASIVIRQTGREIYHQGGYLFENLELWLPYAYPETLTEAENGRHFLDVDRILSVDRPFNFSQKPIC